MPRPRSEGRPLWDSMFPLRLRCRLLKVSPSGYDTRQRRALSRWAQDELTAAIRTLHAESDGVYGNPKIWQVYRQQGDRCRKHRIAQLMLKEGLCRIPALTRWK